MTKRRDPSRLKKRGEDVDYVFVSFFCGFEMSKSDASGSVCEKKLYDLFMPFLTSRKKSIKTIMVDMIDICSMSEKQLDNL